VKISSSGRRATSRAAALAALALVTSCGSVGCGGANEASPGAPVPGVSRGALRAPVDFTFDSLDDRPVSGVATRGQPTIIAFVTTGSLPAQAQVDFLAVMSRKDGDAVHYMAVALDTPDSRELVELYRKSLKLTFPMAMADDATRAGAGPFGDVTAVPVVVVLDRLGRVVWRAEGRVVKADELRVELNGL
jgi:hypothetical protein